jgi:hypothetical protein
MERIRMLVELRIELPKRQEFATLPSSFLRCIWKPPRSEFKMQELGMGCPENRVAEPSDPPAKVDIVICDLQVSRVQPAHLFEDASTYREASTGDG